MTFESKSEMFRRTDAAMERSLNHRAEKIARDEAMVWERLMAPLRDVLESGHDYAGIGSRMIVVSEERYNAARKALDEMERLTQ